MNISLGRRAQAEFVGTAFLLLAIVGSGIAAARLSPGNAGFQLLLNTVATGLALAVLIALFRPISGAHFNPLISVADLVLGRAEGRATAVYAGAQVGGAVLGTLLANIMFGLSAVSISTKSRAGAGMALSEAIATGGLILVVFGLSRTKAHGVTPAAVGAYVAAMMLATPSTCFANPAVLVSRTLTNTFTGISPVSVPLFFIGEVAGAVIAVVLLKGMFPRNRDVHMEQEAAT